MIKEPVEFEATLDRAQTRSYIGREVGNFATSVSEASDLALANRVASRCSPLSTAT